MCVVFEFLKIITEDNIENNTIEFDEGRIVYTENLSGEEYDKKISKNS